MKLTRFVCRGIQIPLMEPYSAFREVCPACGKSNKAKFQAMDTRVSNIAPVGVKPSNRTIEGVFERLDGVGRGMGRVAGNEGPEPAIDSAFQSENGHS
jgi:hypothetical protein